MQSELVVAAAKTGAVVNIKHGQFLAPENMAKPVKKIEDSGNDRIIVTERGYTFGYNDLVVDPRSFYLLNQIGYPVVFDAGHSIRKYGIPSKDPRGSARQFLDDARARRASRPASTASSSRRTRARPMRSATRRASTLSTISRASCDR